MKIHPREQQLKCSVCKVSFTQPADLSRNLLSIHTKERLYVCRHLINDGKECCGRSFSRKDVLQKHLATYHGQGKSLKCEYCGYKNLDRSNFNKHVKSNHSHLHPFVCLAVVNGESCPFRLKTLKSYIIHLSSFHKIKSTEEREKFISNHYRNLQKQIELLHSRHKTGKRAKDPECNSRKKPHFQEE